MSLWVQREKDIGGLKMNKLNVVGDANVAGILLSMTQSTECWASMYIGDTSITTESNGDVNVW